jgi:hypothetical protein
MTGLAATLGTDSPAAAAAIVDALVARGRDLAGWQAGGFQLLVRAAMPAIHEIPTGALLLDGDAAPSELAAGYAGGGPRGLLVGRQPYAVVLADLSRDALLLARNGDGPPLYWARLGRAVLVGSEPAALLAAGVPAEPDPVVMERFLATGDCDDGPATFFAHVRRVLPDQVVEVSGGAIRVQDPPAAPRTTATAALAAADLSGRLGVRLGGGIGAAAVLAAALPRVGPRRQLLLYSASFPELVAAGSAQRAATLLGPPPFRFGAHASPNVTGSAFRHRALPFFTDEIDVDSYLADLGEPTPELDDWLRWAIARRVAGEVDTLVDAGAGAHLSRLADRVTSRFGVGLRVPLRDVPEAGRRAELAAVVQRGLPPAAAVATAEEVEQGTEAMLTGLLSRMRAELVTTFLRPRGTSGGLADTLALASGSPVDVRSLWRRYLVERWLRQVTGDDRSRRPTRRQLPGMAAVRTELFAAGDKIPEKIAWYVGEAVARLGPSMPWHVLLAAKPVAVMQGRARHLWDVQPSRAARLLHRLSRRGQGPRTPWAMQVAIDEGGRWRLALAVLCAAVDRTLRHAGRFRSRPGRGQGWYARIAGPAVRAIREPREDAPAPSHVAVVPAPAVPGRVAAEVVAALRTAAPDSAYRLLRGCAVISAAGDVLGWAGRGAPPPVAADVFGDDLTPVVIAVPGHGRRS